MVVVGGGSARIGEMEHSVREAVTRGWHTMQNEQGARMERTEDRGRHPWVWQRRDFYLCVSRVITAVLIIFSDQNRASDVDSQGFLSDLPEMWLAVKCRLPENCHSGMSQVTLKMNCCTFTASIKLCSEAEKAADSSGRFKGLFLLEGVILKEN